MTFKKAIRELEKAVHHLGHMSMSPDEKHDPWTDSMRRALGTVGHNRHFTGKDLAECMGISTTEAKGRLNRLTRAGWVGLDGDGYYVTPLGWNWIHGGVESPRRRIRSTEQASTWHVQFRMPGSPWVWLKPGGSTTNPDNAYVFANRDEAQAQANAMMGPRSSIETRVVSRPIGGSQSPTNPVGTDRSTHPTVVEYAVQDLFKGKSIAAAARATAKKLSGFENMFLGPGVTLVDAKELEAALWTRLVEYVVSRMKHIRIGYEHFALDGTLKHFHQKPTERAKLKALVIKAVGRDPFVGETS
jgi:hypothetical protein